MGLSCLACAATHAEENQPASGEAAFDTEHIFGFAEGSDTGKRGEVELESITVGSFGALSGTYANINNETSLRYSLSDELRLSLGSLADYYTIHQVPNLRNHGGFGFSGLIAEARWHIFDWRTDPFGMAFSFNPLWRQTDATSGETLSNYGLPIAILADKEIIPSKLFAAVNLAYTPSFFRLNGAFRHDDAFTDSVRVLSDRATSVAGRRAGSRKPRAKRHTRRARSVFRAAALYRLCREFIHKARLDHSNTRYRLSIDRCREFSPPPGRAAIRGYFLMRGASRG